MKTIDLFTRFMWLFTKKNLNIYMEKFDQDTDALRRRGVASPEDLTNVLKEQKEQLETIELEAEKALAEAGGDYDTAIEEAYTAKNPILLEKLRVMQKVANQGD